MKLFELGALAALVAVVAVAPLARADDLPSETAHVEEIPTGSRDHWVALGDLNPLGSLDTRVVLYDADKGKMLGLLSTGYWSSLSFFPKGRSDIVTLETYFEKGTRGKRNDFAVIYDGKTLLPTAEIPIPPRRMTAFTQTRMADLTDDGRFLAITNFTPAQSVSLVDLKTKTFVGETATPGCGQIYPAGARKIAILCGDASLKTLTLDDQGKIIAQADGKPFFDPFKDPVLVHAARFGNDWLFVSMDGYIHDVDTSGEAATLKDTWSLVTDSERAKGWRTGGIQALCVHEKSKQLYALMRKGGPETYEEPADVVWVFDLTTHKRIETIDLANTTMAINVSQDDKPLLNAASFKTVIPYWSLAALSIIGIKFEELDVVKPALDVYDAKTGAHLRTVNHVANFATSVTQP